MRVSGTRLLHSAIRLSDVAFPASDTLLARTRLIYLHLDNLLSFAKRDRDGKVDAYFLGYLPDELILLFFREGELVTAAGIGAGQRSVLPIAEAVRRLKADPERAEAAYCAAPLAQLEWMYQACAAPAEPWVVDSKHPELIFPRVVEESLTGGLEIISNGRVNYLQFERGKFTGGYFYARPESVPLPAYIEGIFQPDAEGIRPALSVSGCGDSAMLRLCQIDAPNAGSGVLLGVEKRKKEAGKDETIEVEYLNLLTDEGMRSVAMDSINRIKLLDAGLDADFRKALAVLASGHNMDKKSVTLDFLGQGKRPVRVGYIQETHVWKTSYRLVLDEKGAPFLQGWAIVENTTDDDWNNVRLTLVSGRPISYRMDLYEPMYVQRPLEQLQLYASLRAQTYGQDLAQADERFGGLA